MAGLDPCADSALNFVFYRYTPPLAAAVISGLPIPQHLACVFQAAVRSSPQKTPRPSPAAKNTILVGLGIQVLFFGRFIITVLLFHQRIVRSPTPTSTRPEHAIPWKGLTYILYATLLLIMVRSIFRVAEYAQGSDGALQGREVHIHVFDATLMLVTAGLLNWWHPSRVLGRDMDLTRARRG